MSASKTKGHNARERKNATQDIEDMLAPKSFSKPEVERIRVLILKWFYANRRRLPWRGDAPPYDSALEIKAAADVRAAKSRKRARGPMDRFMRKDVAVTADAAAAGAGSGSNVSDGVDGGGSGGGGGGNGDAGCDATAAPVDRGSASGRVSAYHTWVSEIMLQQTRVETVIPYYTRWTERWPDPAALAAATAEEVNAAWAGLGYYRRARSLHAGAQHLAAAVDGNVVRVLSRLRAMGVDAKAPALSRKCWSLAGQLVLGSAAPGDQNQALMELGATLCTPTAPRCASCPLRGVCHAAAAWGVAPGSVPDPGSGPGSGAGLAAASTSAGAQAAGTGAQPLAAEVTQISAAQAAMFPRVTKRKPPRVEAHALCVVRRHAAGPGEGAGAAASAAAGVEQFLVTRRPPGGLLAGQWEFPMAEIKTGTVAPKAKKKKRAAGGSGAAATVAAVSSSSAAAAVEALARSALGFDLKAAAAGRGAVREIVGEVRHEFSHVRHHMRVEQLTLGGPVPAPAGGAREARWATRAELRRLGLTAGMAKVLRRIDVHNSSTTARPGGKGKTS
eukprot:g3724.t1